MRFLLILLCLTACSTKLSTTPPQVIAVGISAVASDLCNDLIDQEFQTLDIKLSPQQVECAKARAYRKCGFFFLEFVRLEAQKGRPIEWGKEWCTADFTETAMEEVAKHCEGIEEDPLPEEVANELADGIVDRLRDFTAAAKAPLN
jgi:hypothetical protein